MASFANLRRVAVSVAALGACTAVFFVALAPAPVSAQKKRRARAKAETLATPAEAPRPFRAGEKLDYRVQWSKLVNAATVQLSVSERRSFYGHEAWHFQGLAHTIDPMRYLYALDDQFDSYTESATLASLQYEMYVREQGKQEKAVFRMSTDGGSAPGEVPAVRVLPETRDPLGFLYYLRAVDWQRTQEARSAVFDGRKLYEIWARRGVQGAAVRVPAGNYTASRIDLRIFDRGHELKDTRFSVWLAQDASRLPILIEAEVPFGLARVELTGAH